MKNVLQEQPIILSKSTSDNPLPFTSAGQVEVALFERSQRWLLIDKLAVQLNPRALATSAQLPITPNYISQLLAAAYEIKIGTRLVDLTDDFVPLLSLSQMLSAIAETEPYVGINGGVGPAQALANLNILEWVFPRPLLLRPKESIKVAFRTRGVTDVPGILSELANLTSDSETEGVIFNVAAKGTLVKVNAPSTDGRDVPWMTAQTFDARDVVGSVATGAGAQKIEKMLENRTNKVLQTHSLCGRWIEWATNARTYPEMSKMFPTVEFKYGDPLTSISDYAGYDICKRVPFQTVFPPQIGAAVQFHGAMQTRDVLKVTLERDPRNAEPETEFYNTRQALLTLHGWREEAK